MSSGMDTLDRIDQRLARLETNQQMLVDAVRRLSTMVATLVGQCPRCRLQLAEADILPPETAS